MDAPTRRTRVPVVTAQKLKRQLHDGGEIAVLVQPVGEDGFPPDLFDAIAAARRDEADVLRAVSVSDMAAQRGLAFAA